MDKDCIIMYHLGAGDGFTMYAAVRHYQKIYKAVHIFCLNRNRHAIMQLYQPYNNVMINIIEDWDVVSPHKKLTQTFESQSKQFDLLLCGNYHGLFEGSNGFWERFYDHLHLPYNMRYHYPDINRNKEREMALHNAVISKYGEKYIFLHDHRGIKYINYYAGRPTVHVASELPVFHPNFNYYTDSEHAYHHLWSSELLSDNLLDYCTLIENATEIHITDSAFSCLMPFLDLQNVKKKCIYTGYDIIGYHDAYKNWDVVEGS